MRSHPADVSVLTRPLALAAGGPAQFAIRPEGAELRGPGVGDHDHAVGEARRAGDELELLRRVAPHDAELH